MAGCVGALDFCLKSATICGFSYAPLPLALTEADNYTDVYCIDIYGSTEYKYALFYLCNRKMGVLTQEL